MGVIALFTIVLVIVIVFAVSLVVVLGRRRQTGKPTEVASAPESTAPAPNQASLRDAILVPTIVSVISGVITALVLWLLGVNR